MSHKLLHWKRNGMLLGFCLPLLIWGQGTRFSLIPESKSGIDFRNTIKDTREQNILIYSNFYGGGGVGVGDFNQDGLPDLYFAGNLVGDRLYLNEGDFQFQDVTETAGILNRGGWSSGVVVADVNNDGWDDVYVTKELYDNQPDLRRNELYINQQDGTFLEQAEKYGLDHDARTRHATFLDYDKDGWLDLYLLNQPPNPGNFSEMFDIDKTQEQFTSRLFRNTGKGKFVETTEETGIAKVGFPNSVTASDLNNDGWTDLYVANDFDAPDWFFLNQGDGTFVNVLDSAMQHISYFSMGVDAADINNDGWQDLMVLDMQAEDNFRIKSNMSGMDPAAFWKVYNNGGHYQYMYNAVQLNQGPASPTSSLPQFSDIAQLTGMSSTDWSWSNLIADFDNDGYKDVFVTNGLLRDIRNTDSDKNFGKYVEKEVNEFIANNPNAGDVSIWDILDLEEALAVIPSVPLNNYAFKNNGDLTFTKVIEEWGFDLPTFSNGAAYADLDLDGDLDLIISNVNEVAYLYRNETQGQNYLRIAIADLKKHRSPLGVKIKLETSDGPQWYEFTSVRGMYSTSEQMAHFGLAPGTELLGAEVIWWDGSSTYLSDLKPNQLLKIDYRKTERKDAGQAAPQRPLFETVTMEDPFRHRENRFDDYAKQVLLPHKMSQFGPALAKGDINGDGVEDFVIGGAMGQQAAVYLQNTDGFVPMDQPIFEEDRIFEDLDAALFDADGDGDLDLYMVSGGNALKPNDGLYQDRLYLNDGQGNFSRDITRLPQFYDSGSCVRPADIDQDGDMDLFIGGRHLPWSYPEPANSRILLNEGGSFQDVTEKWAPDFLPLGLVTDAQWTDVNQDGLLDLMIVGEWMPITLFEQQANHRFRNVTAEKSLDHTTGWWYSLTAKDLDGDGKDEYIAGNLGLNYKYQSRENEPFEVFYNDFDNNGKRDIVLSYYNFGEKFPLRGRSCSSQQVPMLKQKFPTYNLFAGSDLETVYGENMLNKSLQYQAETFASVSLDVQANGVFSIQPLPNEAQISSINATLAEDFDRDGQLELLLAGNLYTAEVETPRNDASVGLLLEGEPGQGFQAVPPKESGVMLPYDVKDMVSISRPDGTRWIIVACNDDQLRILATKASINSQDGK